MIMMADESAETGAVLSKRPKVDKVALLKEKLALLPTKFELPNWAGDPPAGLHIDVMKDGKLIQKVMIDEKPCYLFGRNREVCDFALDHESASRLHAAFVWHKQLQRAFLIDCGSVHGTFVGKLRLDAHKPTQIPVGTELHFGASTRTYIVRERPKSAATFNPRNLLGMSSAGARDRDGDALHSELDDFRSAIGGSTGSALDNSLNLPESESEIDNLTEFNTMHNRRVGTLTEIQDPPRRILDSSRRNRYVRFRDQIDVINPEDVDPSIGRFRNLCTTTVIPTTSKPSVPSAGPTPASVSTSSATVTTAPTAVTSAVVSRPRPEASASRASVSLNHAVLTGGSSVLAKLGLTVNIAPDIAPAEPVLPNEIEPADLYYGIYSADSATAALPTTWRSSATAATETAGRSKSEDEPRKKKYAKEAWPGRHPPTVSSLHS